MRTQRLSSILLLALIVCCVPAPASTSGYVNDKLTPEQLIEDVDFYVKTLQETHINPFVHVPEAEWRAQVDRIKSQITKQGAMTREDFWLIFAPLVSSLQDRHTVVVEPRFLLQNNTTKYLPVRTVYLNRKLVVTSSVADVQIAPGTVITSINHMNAEDVVRKLSQYTYGSDKERMRSAGAWLWIGASEVFGKPETFALTFSDGRSVELKGQTLSEIAEKERATKTQTGNAPLDLQFLDGNVAYVNASTFSYDLQKYEVLLNDVFTRIKAAGARHLIVDVRSNTGGNSMLGNALLDMFNAKPFKTYAATWKRSAQYVEKMRNDGVTLPDRYLALKPGDLLTIESSTVTPRESRLRFTGDGYILSGEETFSSGLNFLGTVKDNKLAKIIGEQPTTPACFPGELYIFKLPNSGLRVTSSVKYWMAPAGCKGERPLAPDVVVTKQVEDYATGKDRILDKALDLIRTPRRAEGRGRSRK
ncbi:MAG TPA: S41 family peptidase [Pyrinomonadaceae bacterium]|nr:S41 family peptidase [Pyrinomonadaceae bacterium]